MAANRGLGTLKVIWHQGAQLCKFGCSQARALSTDQFLNLIWEPAFTQQAVFLAFLDGHLGQDGFILRTHTGGF